MDNLLEIQDLVKHYPTFSLNNVSFSLPAGYITGFIGPNGAGKTTTLKSMLGMIRPDSGRVRLFGQDALAPGAETLKDQIGVVMDLPFYVDDWTPKDVENAVRPFYTAWDTARYAGLLRDFSIDPSKKVKELSRGMKVKLMLAAALSHNARLLLLDEPTSGLDPVARDELMDILSEFIQDEGRSVLFSTHITSDLEKVADYITYIRGGEIVFTGPKDTLMENYMMLKGGPEELAALPAEKIIGLRTHATGFEGMLAQQDRQLLPAGVLTEPVSLEEIVVFMNKGGGHNA